MAPVRLLWCLCTIQASLRPHNAVPPGPTRPAAHESSSSHKKRLNEDSFGSVSRPAFPAFASLPGPPTVAATVGGPGREAKAENAGRDTEPSECCFRPFSWLDDDSCAAGRVGPGGAALRGLKLASIVHRHHSSLTGAILVTHDQSCGVRLPFGCCCVASRG